MTNPSTSSAQQPSLKGAIDRLDSALATLDGALDPILARLSRAETQVSQSESFGEDRARMAAELDDAKADAQALQSQLTAREAEFAALSRDTRTELDDTIATLRDVLRGAA